MLNRDWIVDVYTVQASLLHQVIAIWLCICMVLYMHRCT